MFTLKANASKAAFITLARLLFSDGVILIDCQQHTSHLKSLGGVDLGRKEFLSLLRETLPPREPRIDRRGSWRELLTRD
jgi:leucyl/phenylalanyl-tRNA--protein transferase